MWKNLCVLLVLVQVWGDHGVTIPQHLVERFPELTTLHKRVQKIEQTTPNKIQKTTGYVEPLTVLEYKPTTTFYYPRPSTLPQLIPPGTPWPDSPKSTTVQNKFGEETTPSPFTSIVKSTTKENHEVTTVKLSTSSVEIKVETTTNNLDDNTVTENKIVTIENKNSVDDNKTTTEINKTEAPEDKTEATQNKPPTEHQPSSPTPTTLLFNKETIPFLSKKTPVSSTHLVLTYKPTRPWYVPEPPTIGQIIPPGKPLPAFPQEYPSFSQTTRPPWLLNKPKGNLQELQSLEPNALQYYGAAITARPKYGAQPFTSRVEKSTVSDIVDILKEMQRIGAKPSPASLPSDLLPFDDHGALPLGARKPQTAFTNYRIQKRV